MNRKHLSIVCIIFLYILLQCDFVYAKTFQVQILDQPSSPNAVFSAKIVASDFNDLTPNYCYNKDSCFFSGFVNDKSWGETGLGGYGSYDNERISERQRAAREARTMGELAQLLSNRGLLAVTMRDSLPANLGNSPTFCVYAKTSVSNQIAGTLVSNCADAPVAPISCKLTPEQMNLDWGTITNKAAGHLEISKKVNISCTKASNVGLSISGGSIPLNGDVNIRAEFNLGDGWTGKTQLNVLDDIVVEIKSRLVGLENEEGVFYGSAILMMEQL
ncbi:hypothetical protein ABGT23_01910 [Enterobacter cloacae]|uniref:hypothetical protein n=1 Tax=Enterobacter cloacae TaxID=550 RepID=UPI00345CDF64